MQICALLVSLQEEVDLAALPLLSEDDLLSLGVRQRAQRRAVLEAARLLRGAAPRAAPPHQQQAQVQQQQQQQQCGAPLEGARQAGTARPDLVMGAAGSCAGPERPAAVAQASLAHAGIGLMRSSDCGPSDAHARATAPLSGSPAPAARKRRRPAGARGQVRPEARRDAQPRSSAGRAASGAAGAGHNATSGSASTTLRVPDSDSDSDFADSTPPQRAGGPPPGAAAASAQLPGASGPELGGDGLPPGGVACARQGAAPACAVGCVDGGSAPGACLPARPGSACRQPRGQPQQPHQQGTIFVIENWWVALEPAHTGMGTMCLVRSSSRHGPSTLP